MDIKRLLNLKEKLHANFITLDHMGKKKTTKYVLGSFSTQLKVSEIQRLVIWIYKLAINQLINLVVSSSAGGKTHFIALCTYDFFKFRNSVLCVIFLSPTPLGVQVILIAYLNSYLLEFAVIFCFNDFFQLGFT